MVWHFNELEQFVEFKEFENFVDYYTIDTDDLGCLWNGGTEQSAILSETRAVQVVQGFSDFLASRGVGITL